METRSFRKSKSQSQKNNYRYNPYNSNRLNKRTSFTNSRSYPVFIVGRSNAGGGSFSFTVTNGGGGSGTVAQQDGDSGTNDPFSFILPVGGSISGSSFTGTGIELRPA